MIDRLPLEIQIKILCLNPSSCLKFTSKHFYTLYNDLYYDKIVEGFGQDIISLIVRVLPWLKLYIKSLDTFRYASRMVLARQLRLSDTDDDTDDPFNCWYVKDSWKYIYSVLKNNRLFAEYDDYKVDEPTNYVFNHYVEVNQTYLLSYKKKSFLAPGKYNLNIALVAQNVSGLGTTKFEIMYKDHGVPKTQTFFPPTNINDILPKDQFCFLKVGEFSVPPSNNPSNKLVEIQCSMEEIGLYRKLGFSIFFIDISQPTTLFNDFELLYYTVKETNYKYFINMPLKNLYKAIAEVQFGKTATFNESNYSFDFLFDEEIDGDSAEIKHHHHAVEDGSKHGVSNGSSNHDTISEKLIKYRNSPGLSNYSRFFFNNKYKNRYFKFNTIYQRRQFINRYGDFDIDWKDFNDTNEQKDPKDKKCSYDKLGLKWKIPIVGEL